MLGSKMVGRSLVFGLGYVVGTRAGRERYVQIQHAALGLAGQVRQQLAASSEKTPSPIARAARRAWDDSDIKLGT